jgi:hypothetical protein
LNAGTDQDIDTIFAGLIQQRIGVLLVSADPFFPSAHARAAVIQKTPSIRLAT